MDNIYPIYADYHTSTTCFIVASKSKTVTEKIFSDFQSSGLVLAWMFIPHQLKLDPALVEMYQHIKSREDSIKLEDSSKFQGTGITLLYGLGVRNMGMNGLLINGAAEVNILTLP